MKCEIIYEDKEILVVHKPAGLATQSGSVGQADVVSELKSYLAKQGKNGGTPYLGVVHRLDQPVEGLLLFAKTPKAAAALTKQLNQGTLNKKYLAMVCGKPCPEEGELRDFLRKDGNRAEVVTGEEAKYSDAKLAKLSYRVIYGQDDNAASQCEASSQDGKMALHHTASDQEGKVASQCEVSSQDAKAASHRETCDQEGKTDMSRMERGIEYAVLEVRIETGRFHQIRTQLSHAGFPILGDRKYGNDVSNALSEKLGLRSVALCACELECRHPMTGKKLSWTCKPKWLGMERME